MRPTIQTSLLIPLIVVVAVTSCGGGHKQAESSSSSSESPQAEAPLPATLAAELEEDILGCDQGGLRECHDLGHALRKAGRPQAAAAAFEHGCHLGGKATVSRYGPCVLYKPGGSCHVPTCERCMAHPEAPDCKYFDLEGCQNPAEYCFHQTAEVCLEIEQVKLCNSLAGVYKTDMSKGEETCGPRHQELLGRASAAAQEACTRFNASPIADELRARDEDACTNLEFIQRDQGTCNQIDAMRAEGERSDAAFRRELAGMLAQSVHSMASTANQISAARQGYVPAEFVPGAQAKAGDPAAYVNPTTGAHWTSPNLAYIASLVPGGLKTKPAPAAPLGAAATAPVAAQPAAAQAGAGGNCDRCKQGACQQEKSLCEQGTQRACYEAAACLCRCNLDEGGCGNDPAALNECIAKNQASAATFDSDAQAVNPDDRGLPREQPAPSNAASTPPRSAPAGAGRAE